jgi:23S rRNA (uridine2552-2'-O)-methyltransferase
MSRRKSSRRWLKEHFEDEFVRRAQDEGWRSRGVFKLQELDAKDQLLRPGMVVVDLGAAPGGWTEYVCRRLRGTGTLIAVDTLAMDPLAHVDFIQGDFREQQTLDRLLASLGGNSADLVLSDMAPNISGIKAIDQPRSMYLAELARDCAVEILTPGGDFLVKVFQGEGFDSFRQSLRRHFAQVVVRKPRASRDRSRELYLLARNYGM